MAQLVEYDLAKVGVAGSSPVCRSGEALEISSAFFIRLCYTMNTDAVNLKNDGKEVWYG